MSWSIIQSFKRNIINTTTQFKIILMSQMKRPRMNQYSPHDCNYVKISMHKEIYGRILKENSSYVNRTRDICFLISAKLFTNYLFVIIVL